MNIIQVPKIEERKKIVHYLSRSMNKKRKIKILMKQNH